MSTFIAPTFTVVEQRLSWLGSTTDDRRIVVSFNRHPNRTGADDFTIEVTPDQAELPLFKLGAVWGLTPPGCDPELVRIDTNGQGTIADEPQASDCDIQICPLCLCDPCRCTDDSPF